MRVLRMVVGYDGTDFHGWQRQAGRRTVQGVLEEHLNEVLGEPVRLTAAGRTDAGCHARGQVVSLRTASRLPAAALAPSLRRRLPGDLRVWRAAEAPPGFDARRSALARRYAYRLLREEDALLARFAWRPRQGYDPDALARAVAPLEGEHDCAVFRGSGSSPTTSVCRIHRASWRPWEGGVQLDVVANHFLYRMVRSVVGTALALQREGDPGSAMRARLLSRDRARAGPTAPPQGLCLEQVYYVGDPLP